ncbi:MAG: formylglycine-generating enzyme family protein [Planctomycetota bacterium]
MRKRAIWSVVGVIAALAVGCGAPAPTAVEPAADPAGLSPQQQAAAKALGVAAETTNSIGMKLILIPAGEFQMGSREGAWELVTAFEEYGGPPPYFFEDEYPLHRVRITRPFYLGVHEVTLGQFRQFVKDTGYKTDQEKGALFGDGFGFDPKTGTSVRGADYSWQNVGFEQTDDHPVVHVSWNDAVEFCKWLSGKEGKTYRLPTEAEWEYACRAGTSTRYHHGDDPEGLAHVGNVHDATAKAKFPAWQPTIATRDGYVFTAPVGKFKPNPFGLFDVHGNVWEWCADWYGKDYYKTSPLEDPEGPNSGTFHVLRGGSWLNRPDDSRSADRGGDVPAFHYLYDGFRVARTP